MSQTSYETYTEPALVGQKADLGGNSDILSRANGESAAVPFGVCVVQDSTDPNTFALPAATGDYVLGLTLHTHARSTEQGDIDATRMANIIKRGRIWVEPEVAIADVTATPDVYVRISAGAGGTQIGALRHDADTATAVRLVGARFHAPAAWPQNSSNLIQVDLDGSLSLV